VGVNIVDCRFLIADLKTAYEVRQIDNRQFGNRQLPGRAANRMRVNGIRYPGTLFLAGKTSFLLLEVDFMKSRFVILALFCAAVFGLPQAVVGQRTGGQTELSTTQRLDVMSSKLDTMRRS
jgi:hypothetical protein